MGSEWVLGNEFCRFLKLVTSFLFLESVFEDFERTDPMRLKFLVCRLIKVIEIPLRASSHFVLLRVYLEVLLEVLIFELMLNFWRAPGWVQGWWFCG